MDIALVELEPQTLLTVRDEVAMGDLGSFLPRAYAEIEAVLAATGLGPVGPFVAWYHSRPAATTDVSAAVALAPGTELTHGRATTRERAGGPALVATQRGAYARLPEAWMRLEDERLARGLEPRGDLIEEYVTEPAPGGDPAAAVTRLVLPVVRS